MSSHLFAEVSAHLLAVTPTRHWFEHVDRAGPILEQPLQVEHGQAVMADRPGTGTCRNEDAVRRCLVRRPRRGE